MDISREQIKAKGPRFERSWVDRCLENGRGYSTFSGLRDIVENQPGLAEDIVVCRTSLALGDLLAGIPACLFTILLCPDGTRQVLEIQAGQWSGPEIVSRIVSAHERFQSVVVVEINAAQAIIAQRSKEKAPGMPIRSFVTGRNKLSLEHGVESLVAELAAGLWLIPCRASDKRVSLEIGEWISEMLDYGDRKHIGSRLKASCMAGVCFE